jgi:membrane-bound lytic murein transglycosylase B
VVTTTGAPTTSEPPTTTTEPPPATTTEAPVDLAALRPPPPAMDPVSLAAQIAAAEAVLRTPGAPRAEVAQAALAQQIAYRQLGDHPAWDDAVRAALPPELHASMAHHVAARREFQALQKRGAPRMPAWRIVEPPPPEQLLAWYLEAEAEFGIPWYYLAAVNLVETGMGRIAGTSSAGAQGPMQFMPATWAAYGEGDINDHRQAIRAAARYLKANGGPADMANALWNYNHSHHYVRGVEHYAQLIVEHDGGFAAAYHWGIWYRSAAGDVYLPIGYEATERVPAHDYVAAHGYYG